MRTFSKGTRHIGMSNVGVGSAGPNFSQHDKEDHMNKEKIARPTKGPQSSFRKRTGTFGRRAYSVSTKGEAVPVSGVSGALNPAMVTLMAPVGFSAEEDLWFLRSLSAAVSAEFPGRVLTFADLGDDGDDNDTGERSVRVAISSVALTAPKPKATLRERLFIRGFFKGYSTEADEDQSEGPLLVTDSAATAALSLLSMAASAVSGAADALAKACTERAR